MEWLRSVVEVLKFVSPGDVLLEGCLVCSLWRSAAANTELWSLYLDFTPWWDSYRLPDESLSALYKRLTNHHLLYFLSPRHLHLYDSSSPLHPSPIVLEITVPSDSTSAIAVSPDSLCIYWCGGGSPNTRAYQYQTCQTTRLGNMGTPRSLHTLVYAYMGLFVFGGNAGNRLLSSAESKPHEQKSWNPLPNMQCERAGFNASLHKALIYLIGGYTDKCEAFSPHSLTYFSLNFTLPQANSQSCVYISASNVLVVATKGYLTRIDLNNGAEDRREVGESGQMHLWSCSAPVLKGGKLYRGNKEGVGVLDLRTLETAIFAFPS